MEIKKFSYAAILIGQTFTIETTIGIGGLKMEILISWTLAAPQPPYSPDRAPMDLFPNLKSKRGRRFLDQNDLRFDINDIIQKCDK